MLRASDQKNQISILFQNSTSPPNLRAQNKTKKTTRSNIIKEYIFSRYDLVEKKTPKYPVLPIHCDFQSSMIVIAIKLLTGTKSRQFFVF